MKKLLSLALGVVLFSLFSTSLAKSEDLPVEKRENYKLILSKTLYSKKNKVIGDLVYYNKIITLNKKEQFLDASLLNKKHFSSKVLLIAEYHHNNPLFLFVFFDKGINRKTQKIYQGETQIPLSLEEPIFILDTTCSDIIEENDLKLKDENYQCKLVGYLKKME